MPDISPLHAERSRQLRAPTRTGWLEMHLGTRVAIHSMSAAASDPRPAIARAFEEVRTVHRLMSFHDADSDLSRLNRHAAREPVVVDERTVEVIRTALEISRLSSGYFDITIAPELVGNGSLPAPPEAPAPDPSSNWQDIEFVSGHRIYFRKPLWIDLGGIAKGYAVDRAFAICSEALGAHCTVNAGGDMRVGGGLTETIELDVRADDAQRIPRVELSGGALASSGTGANRQHLGPTAAQHIDGTTGQSLDGDLFVSVLTDRCIVADALTKVVMAMGRAADPILATFDATALSHTRAEGWQQWPAASHSPSQNPAYTHQREELQGHHA